MAIRGRRASPGRPVGPQKIKVGVPWKQLTDDSGKEPELTHPGPWLLILVFPKAELGVSNLWPVGPRILRQL